MSPDGSLLASAEESEKESQASDVLRVVTAVCSRLHLVAIQLRDRHNGRETLKIQDEYDVQDLLHGLLRLHFDDIRPEEWTPSYAGSSARMDFLLKAEQIVVEAKMARPGRDAKKIFDELIVDAARYKEHPGCLTLVCFVHDPERVIKNPRGVESDLRKLSDSRLQVIAIIAP
jgi:REase_DpnII-MboI